MLKFINPENLKNNIESLCANLRVTQGEFVFSVPGMLQDMDWNHMDQMHRPFIHRTYQEGMRIALGNNFAFSLTRWGKWPIFISVSDIRLEPGLYYQCMTLAGIIYVHLVISMTEKDRVVHCKMDWYIASHKWLRFLHPLLSKKLFNLNTRLQEEDAQIRKQRLALREKGYKFRSDPPDYYSSNLVATNTIYPECNKTLLVDIRNITSDISHVEIDNQEFLIKRDADNTILVWPANCPHEGGPLKNGAVCDAQITCPWHGLRFTAVKLSAHNTTGTRYGFKYRLDNEVLFIDKLEEKETSKTAELLTVNNTTATSI